jgi:tRNA threonylcarbamoyladenosine biosynthesis protein TsaE
LEKLELDITDISELPFAAKKVLEFANDIKVFTFEAEMGSGKTTFIKQLCTELGSKDNFSSPTYAIVNEYDSPKGKIYHFDLYRVNEPTELYDLGIEEYLESGNYCFIEWPEKAKDLIPENHIGITIKLAKNRKLLAETHNNVEK